MSKQIKTLLALALADCWVHTSIHYGWDYRLGMGGIILCLGYIVLFVVDDGLKGKLDGMEGVKV